MAPSLLSAAQWLLYNDCVFRTRNLYEYVMFHDRDEFVHFVGHKPKKVNLLSIFNQHFGSKDVAGVTYWGALYHTHCHLEEVSHTCREASGNVQTLHAGSSDESRISCGGFCFWLQALVEAPQLVCAS